MQRFKHKENREPRLEHKQGRPRGHVAAPMADRARLDRPSLFAGTNEADQAMDERQSIRLLSKLESAQRPVRTAPSKARRLAERRRSSWQVKALIGLMGLGVVTLLSSFVLVVRDGHKTKDVASLNVAPTAASAVSAQPHSLPPTAKAKELEPERPLAALQTASIENLPESPSVVSASAPGPVVAATVMASASASSKAIAQPKALHAAVKANTQGNPPQPPKARHKSPSSKDEDVALVEAMFQHSGTRRHPKSELTATATALQHQCADLNGAQAATCRARFCVQHTGTAPCQAD
jgi:hypothetical protein